MKNITYSALSFLMIVAPVSSVQAASFEKAQAIPYAHHFQAISPMTIDEVLNPSDLGVALNTVQAVPRPEVVKPETPQEIAKRLVTARFGAGQVAAFEAIITEESQWDATAVNAASGACGLGQFLPCQGLDKMKPEDQLSRTIDYIADRYQTPALAWSFHKRMGWY